MKQKITIGITDCVKYNNYAGWLFDGGKNVAVKKLSCRQNNADDIEECNGIVFSGGEDVHPQFYNKPEYFSLLNEKQLNKKRDEFELEVIEKSFLLKKPVLGICRGLQLINVYCGGTLIYDIPIVTGSTEHGKINGVDQRHTVSVVKNSLLYNITGMESGEINSAHHQCIGLPAKDLTVTANLASVAEGMQWKDPVNKSWLLLVQWHPERMAGQQNPFAENIKNEFIKRSRI